MRKIIYFFSYIFSLLKFWGNSKINAYYVVSEEEFNSNENLHFKEVIYKEAIIKEKIKGGERTHIVKKPFFIVYDKTKNVVRNLKKHLLIGPKNFTDFEKNKDSVINMEAKLESMNNNLTTFREAINDKQSQLDYLKVQIGESNFLNYMQKRGEIKGGANAQP